LLSYGVARLKLTVFKFFHDLGLINAGRHILIDEIEELLEREALEEAAEASSLLNEASQQELAPWRERLDQRIKSERNSRLLAKHAQLILSGCRT